MALLPLARPTIGDAELEAQARALRSGRLVLGPENVALEAAVAAVTGVPAAQVVAVASGTAALHAALWALDLPAGAEVLVPAFTFPAPAHAALALGLEVVPVDVDPHTWNMDPEAAARAVTPRTRAMIVVDQFGLMADYDRLGEIAAAHGLALVEDAACAIGGRDAAGRRAGTVGAAGCFSFHPRKVVTTGEGGVVLSTDPALADRVRQLRHHGMRAVGEFVRVGLNFRMPETCAAVGRAQLERLPDLLAARDHLVGHYVTALAAAGLGDRARALGRQIPPPGVKATWQTFALLLPVGADRARVMAHLRAADIESGPATYALHRIDSLAARFAGRSLPVAGALHDRALALPLFVGMTAGDVERVVAALAGALR